MNQYVSQLSDYIQNSPIISYQIGLTLMVIFIIWLIRLLALKVVDRNVDDAAVRYRWRKNLSYVFAALTIFLIGTIWAEGFKSLGTFLGLLSAGLAIALRDPVSDFAGWIFILWRKPFDIGDRVEIGTVKGDIIDQRIFKFTVLEIGNWIAADQSTGRVIHVPNHHVFTQSVANYTADFSFIWNEMPVLVTFESDWKKAKEICQEIADNQLENFIEQAKSELRRASKSYLIQYRYLTPIVYTEVADSGIKLTIRHLTDPRKRRGISQAIWEDILEAFGEEDTIDFAYPTMRIFKNNVEGKQGTQVPDPPRPPLKGSS